MRGLCATCAREPAAGVLKVPIRKKGLRGLKAGARKELENDLSRLSEESGVAIELRCERSMSADSLMLRGEPFEVQSIREWLQSILPFYDVEIDVDKED